MMLKIKLKKEKKQGKTDNEIYKEIVKETKHTKAFIKNILDILLK